MKPITKIITFLVVALVLIVVITLVRSKTAVAPAITTPVQDTPVTATSSKSYALRDVEQHKSAADCWTAVGDGVYDLSAFVTKHPGGVENITKVCGINGTELFTQMHGSSKKAQSVLASLKIGTFTP